MQKILELIEQVRFAELKKIDKLSNTQEDYLEKCGISKESPTT